MVPADEARHTLEFNDFYMIYPKSSMWGYNFEEPYDGETGKAVDEQFEYTSDNNTEWVTSDDLAKLIKR